MKRPVFRLLASLLAAVAAASLCYSGSVPAPHVVTSGTSGDSSLTIVADTDNNNEGDNAYLKFLQDGGLTGAVVGFDESTGGIGNAFKISTIYGGNLSDGRFSINPSNGRVGVGTTNPGYTLDVNGSLRSNGFYTHTGVVYIRPQNSSNEGGHLQFKKASSSQQNWNIDHYNGNLRVYMSNGVSSHYFHANGNVGIGTSTPDYKLDVNGAIRAKEFFVETGWADFVFEEDYRLAPLSEVESHIAAHGRLPGVPSAAAVQRDGLKVAEAQTIMMQKIEELTLYLLEMKRENEDLRGELDRLRQSLSSR